MPRHRKHPLEGDVGPALADLAAFVPMRIARLFDLMRVAEVELEAVGAADAFGACFPSPVLREYGAEPVYRAHVRELGRRFLANGDPREPTDSELLAAMMLSGLKAPLTTEALHVVEHLLRSSMPDVVRRLPEGERARESWPGQVEEELRAMRRRLRVESRAWRSR